MKYDVSFEIDFRRNTSSGKYIAIEGIDGAGKTLQSERIFQHLKDQGKKVLMVTEPRRTGFVGTLINEILQQRAHITSASLQYLFAADRIEQQEEIIIPALKNGDIVISQRCFWSALPYGIMDRSKDEYDTKEGESLLAALSILSFYNQVVVPDTTFYLDISADVAIKRLTALGGAKELYEKKEKLERIKKGYDWMVKKFPKEFTVINGEQDIEKITEEILSKINL